MDEVAVEVEVLPHGMGIAMPAYQTALSAGADVRAAIADDVVIAPGKLALIPTGLRLAIPAGFEIQVRPRSGLALKHRVGILNSPGTIDADYRGELMIILMNFGEDPFRVGRGDRLAQLVLARVDRIVWRPVPSVDRTSRGEGGFGHTGRE